MRGSEEVGGVCEEVRGGGFRGCEEGGCIERGYAISEEL